MATARALLALLTLASAVHAQPNPYRTESGAWGQLPEGRKWGAISAVYPAPDGRSIWVAERCGQNTCVGRENLDMVFQFDLDGKLLRQFGAGLIAWPHGMHVDAQGNVWITDAGGISNVPAGVGHVIYKFSPDGRVLLTLGKKGVTGDSGDVFNQPSDVLVAPDGSIFVADGHGAGGNNRIMKFSADGKFVKQWGSTGSENGEFRDAHDLAMDSQGRLFVADRANSRIQIFDQEGKHLATWTQFGRPSGLYIDSNDVLYATDSESNARRNPGWRRGIYIGSARSGWVTGFIPDPEPNPDASATSGAEGVAVDALGNVYGAEVGPMTLRRYARAQERMSFFLTSRGPGEGANLGGLEGADRHCALLAASVGRGDAEWRAYLSAPGVNARDRIGTGPWHNAHGALIAADVAALHAPENLLTKQTVLNERGEVVNGRGDSPNRHDVLTGSALDGTAVEQTCAAWTSSGDGSAQVGHHDRAGGGQNPTSWNSAHASRGCSQEQLRSSGGDGLFYCFAVGPARAAGTR